MSGVTMCDNTAIIKLRKSRGENQSEFWGRVGLTQSCGSRYESGRPMPEPTARLYGIVYGKAPLAVVAKLRGVKIDQLKAGR